MSLLVLRKGEVVMTTEAMLKRIKTGRVTIINGPDRLTLSLAVFEGSPVEFTLDGHRTGIAVTLWGIRCNDSGRRYWMYWGRTVDKEFDVRGSYWMRDGKRAGYMELNPKPF